MDLLSFRLHEDFINYVDMLSSYRYRYSSLYDYFVHSLQDKLCKLEHDVNSNHHSTRVTLPDPVLISLRQMPLPVNRWLAAIDILIP